MSIVFFLMAALFAAGFYLYRVRGKKKLPLVAVVVEGGADVTERLLWFLWMEKNWYGSIHEVQIFLSGDGQAQRIAAAFCLHRQFSLLEDIPQAEHMICLRPQMDWAQVDEQLGQFPFLRNGKKTKNNAGKVSEEK